MLQDWPLAIRAGEIEVVETPLGIRLRILADLRPPVDIYVAPERVAGLCRALRRLEPPAPPPSPLHKRP